MKRGLNALRSSVETPSVLGGKKACRHESLCSTPVEGLGPLQHGTPGSEGGERREAQIPETTQRRLAGFCLNTPISLSQAEGAETPTLLKEQQYDQQQQQPAKDGSAASSGGGSTGRRRTRHSRLGRDLSNLPTPMSVAAGPADRAACDGDEDMRTATTARKQQPRRVPSQAQRRHMQVTFLSDLLSPAPTLGGPVHTPHGSLAAAAAAAAPSSAGLLTVGCAAGDEDGFVLHTSQSYIRASQPAISPSVAAGLSAAPDDERGAEGQAEPFTTPSQDSREPPALSPSNVTSIATAATRASSFDQPQPLVQQQQPLVQQQQALPGLMLPPAGRTGSSSSGALGGAAGVPGPAGPSRFRSSKGSSSLDSLCGPPAIAAAAAGGAPGLPAGAGQDCEAVAALAGSSTPGDGLALLLGVGQLEETTTPELELVGMPASQEAGSQAYSQGGTGAGGAAAPPTTAHRAPAALLPPAAAGGRGGAGAGSSSSGAGRVVCEEVTAKQVLFPIFRPKSQRKCVILVRHGESTYNKQDAHGKSWADPHIFDAPLTAKGRQQAVAAREALRRVLDKHAHLGSTLWLCSPLSRAIETMLLAAPDVEALAVLQQQQQAGHGAAAVSQHQQQQEQHRVMVLSLIAEHCATTGDVGRPASQLAAAFPALAGQLGELPEEWWFNPCAQNRNCAMQRLFQRVESAEQCRRRVSEFSRWLRGRPEQLVVAFGHSTFWKYFANSKARLRNCEVLQIWW